MAGKKNPTKKTQKQIPELGVEIENENGSSSHGKTRKRRERERDGVLSLAFATRKWKQGGLLCALFTHQTQF